ncbi:MAG: ABC transporter substrate-binding protein [Christensenellales bacterium]|jgi:lactose/L-arabinose transport system substrate-binding protein
MKKLLAILMALCLLVPAFAVAQAEEETTITVWCWDPAFNLYAMEEAAKIYAEINPNVTVEIVDVTSGDNETLQTTAFMSGDVSSLPDIILMQDNSGQKFLGNFSEHYLELSDYINYDDFAPYKIANFTYEGGRYAVPFDNGAAAMFIRTDILAEAGYTLADVTDITWDELIEIGKVIKEKTGKYLISAQAGYSDFIMMMTQSMGVWFFDDAGAPQLTNDVFVEIVEQVVRIAESGIVYEAVDWADYIAGFQSGNCASTIQGCWIMASIVLAEDQAGLWGMTTIPRLNLEGAANYSSQGGSSWLVLRSEDEAAAADFLANTFAGSSELYQIILPTSSAITTYLPAAGGEAYGVAHEFFAGQKIFEDLLAYAENIPSVSYGVYNYEARDLVGEAVIEVLNGADVAGALQTAQEELEFAME